MSHLQDHVAIIISECDVLEDIFSDRRDAMTAINIIKNAARRIASTINSQSQAASEIIPDDQRAQSRQSAW